MITNDVLLVILSLAAKDHHEQDNGSNESLSDAANTLSNRLNGYCNSFRYDPSSFIPNAICCVKYASEY